MRRVLALVAFGLFSLAACKSVPEWERGKKIVHYGLRANVKSLDPVMASTQYDGLAQAQVYETLFTYKYLKRPYELEPLLAARMPDISEDGLTYTFTLKEGVRFHDDECFPGGKGRELVAQDMIYSLMRMADRDLTPGGWWIYQDRIVGFDEFQKRMEDRPQGAPFDWDARIEGLRVVDKYRFQIELKRPFPQLLFILAMGYSAAVPRECAEYYGQRFGDVAVGTGPFVLRKFERDVRLIYEKNPHYHEVLYPSEASPEMAERGLLAPAGQRVPFVDGLVFPIYETSEPMWLKFRAGDLDMAQVPNEYLDGVFDANLELRSHMVEEGLENYNLPLLDFIYRGFNMKDPLVGGYTEEKRALRCAIQAAVDTAEINDAFYNNTTVLYDGPIPPGLEGYVPGVTSPYRGPNIELAKELLAKAGYPDGKGLPPLQYFTDKTSHSVQSFEMLKRQLSRANIPIEGHFDSFAELSTKLKRSKAQMFGLAWGADYPDAENFLQLFYGPNKSPGSNNFNYDNPEYNALYEKIRVMQPSPERTALYRQMRDIIIRDCPAFGSMARTRFYVWKGVKNVMPAEVFYDWFKYLDVEPTR